MDLTTKVNEIIPVALSDILVEFNVRYGWDAENILDSYQEGIIQLMQSIAQWGFKKNEPIEGFFRDGKFIVLEGHRRLKSAQALFEQNPDKSLGDGLKPGEVWCFVSKEPTNILDLVASQISANSSQSNTKLDIAKAVGSAFRYLPGKKSEKLQTIGDKLGISRTQADSYLEVSKLPEEVKEWMQNSELGNCEITLSFSTANEIISYYKSNAADLFIEALARVESNPETVETYGSAVTKAWLHNIASELKIGSRKQVKDRQPSTDAFDAEFSNPITTQIEDAHKEHSVTEVLPYEVQQETENQNKISEESQPEKVAIQLKTEETQNRPKVTDITNSTPIERTKTLILKNIALASEYFLKAESDVEKGVLTVELPVELGEEIQELIAVLSESNKQHQTPTKATEDEDFIGMPTSEFINMAYL